MRVIVQLLINFFDKENKFKKKVSHMIQNCERYIATIWEISKKYNKVTKEYFINKTSDENLRTHIRRKGRVLDTLRNLKSYDALSPF